MFKSACDDLWSQDVFQADTCSQFLCFRLNEWVMTQKIKSDARDHQLPAA